MSLRLKFFLAFSLLAGLAITVGWYGMRSLSVTRDLVVRLYDEPLMGVSYTRAASETLNDARGLLDRRLSLGAGLIPGAVASLHRMQNDIAEDLRIVHERVHDRAIIHVLNQAETSITAWFSSGQMILAPPPGGVTALPTRTFITRQSITAAASLDDLVEQVTALGFVYRERATEEMRTSNVTIVGLTGGIFAISALFVLLFAHSLLRPIHTATRIAENVAAGNVVDIMSTTRRDEIGRLLTSLSIMQSNLRNRAAHAAALLQEKDQTAKNLREINLRFDTALENISQGLSFFDADHRLIVCNWRFGELYGLTPEQTQAGALLSDILRHRVAAGSFPEMTPADYLARRAALSAAQQNYDVTDRLHNGRIILMHYQPLPDGSWVTTHEDITERRHAEANIAFMARHDALTRLPNRVLFRERLEQAIDMAGRGLSCAVLFLDLDHFKFINDTLGHPVGDGLLQAAADRLRSCVRETDTVARLGGDEFVIIQSLVKQLDDTELLANRITTAFRDPFDIDGHQITIGATIGIAVAPKDGATSEKLLKNADIALYLAKNEGRGTARFFEPEMDLRIQERRMMEMDLQSAVARGEFEIYYQPVINLAAGKVVGFEALLRWCHPVHGFVPPVKFIPIAEETGLIVAIGEWVLRTACFEAENWPADIHVAVNLSPVQFKKGDLVAAVKAALDASGLQPNRLELEITEMVKLQTTAGNLAALHELRAMGMAVALDDFGTGYSSLGYLSSFPFDRIKIDQSFVRDMTDKKEAMAIVRAIIALSDSLGIKTTAEGVETLEQLKILQEEGCLDIQGYFFSRPQPASQLPSLIKSLQQVGERTK